MYAVFEAATVSSAIVNIPSVLLPAAVQHPVGVLYQGKYAAIVAVFEEYVYISYPLGSVLPWNIRHFSEFPHPEPFGL